MFAPGGKLVSFRVFSKLLYALGVKQGFLAGLILSAQSEPVNRLAYAQLSTVPKVVSVGAAWNVASKHHASGRHVAPVFTDFSVVPLPA
eukprot:1160887-Pelagomonas_calceolata.AAC.6